MTRPPITRAAIGLRVKSGKAIAVVLRGPAESPLVVWRGELPLAPRGTRMPWQPFHKVIDLPWEKARTVAAGEAKKAQAASARALRELLEGLRVPRGSEADPDFHVVAAGIVAGGGQDPGQIPSPHIRAHAAEGRLFREAAEFAAEANGLTRLTFSQKDLYSTLARELKRTAAAAMSQVAALGGKRIKPWRSEEKEAAAAAWAALAESGRHACLPDSVP